MANDTRIMMVNWSTSTTVSQGNYNWLRRSSVQTSQDQCLFDCEEFGSFNTRRLHDKMMSFDDGLFELNHNLKLFRRSTSSTRT